MVSRVASQVQLTLYASDVIESIAFFVANPMVPNDLLSLSASCSEVRNVVTRLLKAMRAEYRLIEQMFVPNYICIINNKLVERFDGLGKLMKAQIIWLSSARNDLVGHVHMLCTLFNRDLLSLKKICLDHGNLSVCIHEFSALQASSAPSLTSLSLIGTRIDFSGADCLAAMLCRSSAPNLQRLYIDDNPIGNLGLATLSQALTQCKKIYVFSAIDVSANECGVSASLSHLSLCPNLFSLNLRGNLVANTFYSQLCTWLQESRDDLFPQLKFISVCDLSFNERPMSDALDNKRVLRLTRRWFRSHTRTPHPHLM